jgi:hypothetical protein
MGCPWPIPAQSKTKGNSICEAQICTAEQKALDACYHFLVSEAGEDHDVSL